MHLALGGGTERHHNQRVIAQVDQNSRIGAAVDRWCVNHDMPIAITRTQLIDKTAHSRRGKKFGSRLTTTTRWNHAQTAHASRINNVFDIESYVFEIIDEPVVGFNRQHAMQRWIV